MEGLTRSCSCSFKMVNFVIMRISMKHPFKRDIIGIALFVFLDCIMHSEFLTVLALDSSVLTSEPVVV
jgi:hypothetical protein